MKNPETYITEACLALSLPNPQLITSERFRWTISHPTDDFYKHALKLERKLQEITKRPIELMFTKLDDKNKRAGRNGRE